MTERTAAEKPASGFRVRNYLTLIMILIVLISFSLGLALAFGSANFTAGQTWFLITILAAFAFFSVATVTRLVIRHSKRLEVGEFDHTIEWRTSSPDKQKRRLAAEVLELAQELDLPREQLADLRSAFIVAEDLALRKIQNDVGIPLMRKVAVGNADFDAIFIDGDLITCIVVTFLVRPDLPQEKINRILRETSAAKNFIDGIREGSRVRLLLSLVTQLGRKDEARLRSTLADRFKSTPVDVDIQWMDFQKLQRVYAADE